MSLSHLARNGVQLLRSAQRNSAEKAVAGQAAVKRNRFVQLTGGTKSVNRDLEAATANT
jgi:hypothetical protein